MPLVSKCEDLAQLLRSEHGLRKLSDLIERVELHETRLDVVVDVKSLARRLDLASGPIAVPPLILSKALSLTRSGRAVRLVYSNGAIASTKAANPNLIELIERGRKWWGILHTGKAGPTELAAREGYTASYVSRVARLAFLAPQVVEAILAGRQKASVSSALLLQYDVIPDNWEDQVNLLVAT